MVREARPVMEVAVPSVHACSSNNNAHQQLDLSTLRAGMSRLMNQNQELIQQNKDLKKVIQTAMTNSDEQMNQNQELIQQNKDLKKDFQTALTKLAEQSNQCDKLFRQNQELKEIYQNTVTELREQKKQNKELIQQNQEMKLRFEEFEKKISDEMEQTKISHQEANKLNQTLTSHIEALVMDLKKKDAIIWSRDEAITYLQTQIDELKKRMHEKDGNSFWRDIWEVIKKHLQKGKN